MRMIYKRNVVISANHHNPWTNISLRIFLFRLCITQKISCCQSILISIPIITVIKIIRKNFKAINIFSSLAQ